MSSQQPVPPAKTPQNGAPGETNLPARHRKGKLWRVIFIISTGIALFSLLVLLLNILNQTFGYAAITYKVLPASILAEGQNLEEMTCAQIAPLLKDNVSKNRYKQLESEQSFDSRSTENCQELLVIEVFEPVAKETWNLFASLTRGDEIRAYAQEKYPDGELVFRYWLTREFLQTPQSSDPLVAGIQTAILGSLFIIVITVGFAFPIGISAAIYLEEYAGHSRINRIIQTNINNLAGVPSIIYGMLGLAFFARALEPITSGAVFGVADPTTANGRTILSAGLTLALLVLPVIIINSQEAIKAVPGSLREAAYGMGATKWQTIWHHVLPYAIPGILTGTILSVSRAFGETAPLVVLGASTYITTNPDDIFSKFTTIPIQVYQWTARPQDAFRNIAAAAIVVLLIMLLTLNGVAIILRNRFSRRLR
jgi:phosphate transport system permease protein